MKKAIIPAAVTPQSTIEFLLTVDKHDVSSKKDQNLHTGFSELCNSFSFVDKISKANNVFLQQHNRLWILPIFSL